MHTQFKEPLKRFPGNLLQLEVKDMEFGKRKLINTESENVIQALVILYILTLV